MEILGAILIAMNFQLSYGDSEFALWEDTREAYIMHQYITPEFNVEAKYKFFYLGGGIRVPVVKDETNQVMGGFKPIQAAFPLKIGIMGEHFNIGASWNCHHPFFVYLDGNAYNRTVRDRVEGSVWEVFIKISGEFHPFK